MNKTVIPVMQIEAARARVRSGDRMAFVGASHPDVWLAGGGQVVRLPAEVAAISGATLRGMPVVVVGEDDVAQLIASMLVQQGYSSVSVLEDGLRGWSALGFERTATVPDEVYPSAW